MDLSMLRPSLKADHLYYPLLAFFFGLALTMIFRQAEVATSASALYAWVLNDRFSLSLFLLALFVLVWQAAFALRYTPFPFVDRARLPALTVIIPAYNEGAQILSTVRSVMASQYPRQRLQVVCIDDGSQDDTCRWMKMAKREFPGNLQVIRQAKNAGKRAALMVGFAKTKGQVVVTLDSDSEILPGTLAELVSPFVLDQRVGSVAGNVRVLNIAEGAIPKMMEVSFTSAFDFIRAGQSVYGGVFCTPGALSAYRSEVLLPLIKEWSRQTFMGKPATIGEDRALTNLVLAAGHRVVYQRTAVVLTKVPTTYATLRRMLLRWARSNVRENLVMCSFVFRRFRPNDSDSAWFRLFCALQLIRMTLFEALKCVVVARLLLLHGLVLAALAVGTLLSAFIPGLIHHLRHGGTFGFRWAVPFSFFWLVALSWISLWGLLTATNSGWLTRRPENRKWRLARVSA
jgi:hyaluronan synthase